MTQVSGLHFRRCCRRGSNCQNRLHQMSQRVKYCLIRSLSGTTRSKRTARTLTKSKAEE